MHTLCMQSTKRLAAQIAELRGARGMTQAALADRAGLTRIYVQKIEAGERTPSLDALERIAKALRARLVVNLEPRGGA